MKTPRRHISFDEESLIRQLIKQDVQIGQYRLGCSAERLLVKVNSALPSKGKSPRLSLEGLMARIGKETLPAKQPAIVKPKKLYHSRDLQGDRIYEWISGVRKFLQAHLKWVNSKGKRFFDPVPGSAGDWENGLIESAELDIYRKHLHYMIRLCRRHKDHPAFPVGVNVDEFLSWVNWAISEYYPG